MEKRLVDVINHSRSVVELYINADRTQITEVKCLADHKVKEYKYGIDDFFRRREIPKQTKNKVAIALSR